MRPARLSILILLAAASFAACKPNKFSYEVSPDVMPTVLVVPTPDGGSTVVEAYQDEKGVRTDFVSDEIVITPRSQAELDQFLADYGGTIIYDNSVPEPPAILKDRVRMPKDGLGATSYTVRVTKFPDLEDFASDAQRRGMRGKYLFSSEDGIALIGLAARAYARGLRVQPNFVCIGHEMLHYTQEQPLSGGGYDNAMFYFAFHGKEESGSSRSSIYRAWQFMEAARYAAPQWYGLAIMDGGFWLNATGGPMQSPSGIGTDLPPSIVQYDFHQDDYIADGGNPNNCTGGNPCPFHGNNTASVAAGFLDNRAAIAGSGGQVSQPYLFKLRLTSDQQDRALRTAIAWGATVVNMSFGGPCNDDCMEYYEEVSDLYSHFQEAYDAGMVIVASAGNDAIDVDANNVIPCCIGGVICVGALESYKYNAISYSNFGASVDIWADTNVPAMPNGDTPNALDTAGGTSASSPLVAGVVMMMKRVNPSLNADQIKTILQNTAYKMGALQSPDPKVQPTGYMDAYRAVMMAADNKIFEDGFEPNNSEGQASPLSPGHYEELTLTPSKWDYYSFSLNDYGSFHFDIEYMTPMGFIFFNLLSDTPETLLGGVSKVSHLEGYHYHAELVPPGNYKLLLSAYNPHYYFMDFEKSESGLPPDEFEANNTFATAKSLLQASGSWDLTLHQENGSDVDYILVEIPQIIALLGREIHILDADTPVRADLLNADTQSVLDSQTGKEITFAFTHESVGVKYVVKVYSAYTRYVLDIRTTSLENPWEDTLLNDPFWWIDPVGPDIRVILREVEDWIAFVAPPRGADYVDLFAQGLSVNLYDSNVELLQGGTALYGGNPAGAPGDMKIGERLDTSALTAGATYLLQVCRTPEPQDTNVTGVTPVQTNMPYTLHTGFAY